MSYSTPKLGQLGLVLCLALIVARTAWSQGSRRAEVGPSEKLGFTVDVAEGWDSVQAPDSALDTSGNIWSGGYSTLFSVSSDYAHTKRRWGLAANTASTFRYAQSMDRLDTISHTVGLGANVRLPKRGSLQVDQSAAYSPAYLYQLFPEADSQALGTPIPANPNYQIVENASYAYATKVALAFGPLTGTRVSTFGTLGRTKTEQQDATFPDVNTYGAGIQIAQHVPNGGISFTYDVGFGQFGSDPSSKQHRFTIGADYSTALSRTRRATFRLELSPTQFDAGPPPTDAIANDQPAAKRWLVNGEVSATYPFRPNWRTTARYRRDVQYLSVLGQPVQSHATRVDLSGQFARRLDFSTSAGYALAESATQAAQALKTYTGQVRVGYSVKRSISIYSEYLYYYYDQGTQDPLQPGLPAVFEQHGIRVGMTWSIQALGR